MSVFSPSLPGLGTTTAPRSRRNDPATSAAARPRNPDATEAAILMIFMGRPPMTDDELCDVVIPVLRMAGLTTWEPTIKSARSRLSKAGLLMPSGEGVSKRGRRMSKWCLAAVHEEAS